MSTSPTFLAWRGSAEASCWRLPLPGADSAHHGTESNLLLQLLSCPRPDSRGISLCLEGIPPAGVPGLDIGLPGMRTGRISSYILAEPVLADKILKKQAEESHPIGRIGAPLDIAYGVLYLASDESSFMTGAELVIDGGWTAH